MTDQEQRVKGVSAEMSVAAELATSEVRRLSLVAAASPVLW